MKLKKVLAVALAATTALSSGVAYDMLGASASSALAAYDKDEPFNGDTITDEKDLGGVFLDGSTTTKNGSIGYTVTEKGTELNNGTTTGGEVKVTSIDIEEDTNSQVIIPARAKADDGSWYKVVEIDLDGGSVNLDYLKHISLERATNLKKVSMRNFDDESIGFNLPTTTGSSVKNITPLEKVDFTNSNVQFVDVEKYIASSTGSLETLELEGLVKDDKDTNGNSINTNWNLSNFTKLKTVNVSKNDYIKKLSVKRGESKVVQGTSGSSVTVDATDKHYAMTLNINGDDGLTDLTVVGLYDKSCSGAVSNANKGVSFITDDVEEGSRNVDLSGFSIERLTINGAGIEGIVLPSDVITAKLANNFIKTADVGGASSMTTLDLSNNMLTEIDVAGCSDLSSLNLSYNFLTSLDVSANDEHLKSELNVRGNYIPKDNFVKASSGQGNLSANNQNEPTIFAFGLTGDGGLKSNSKDKASGIIKLGGSAQIVAAIIVPGAPEGFAEKYAETITWKEANENGGSVTLGETGITSTEYKYDGNGNEYNYGKARIFAYANITGADSKMAAESVNLNIGGKKKTMSVQSDNAVILSYDTTTNLPANKIADEGDNEYIKNFASMFIPQQAAAIPSSGTASIKVGGVIPKVLGNGSETAVDILKGVQLSWNTAVDGTGTSYKYSVGNTSNKNIKITEDTTLSAIYTEKTFGVKFELGNLERNSIRKNSGSKTENMKALNWGDEAALSANGWTSTAKDMGSDDSKDTVDNTFMAWIYKSGNSCKAFEDGAQVFGGKVDVAPKYNDKKGDATLKGLWSDGNFSMNVGNNAITLGLVDLDKNVYALGDLDVSIDTMFDEDASKNRTKLDKKLIAYSNNTGVVEYSGGDDGFLYAKGEGTATVYVYDRANGVAASVAVTVTKDGAAATEDNTAKLQAGEKVKADNGQTVKLNSDGKTVTVSKGKNQKKVTVNTVVIDGVTYKVTAIAANAFKGMSKVQTVVIGNNVKTIGKLAFANCKNLKKVTMGKNVNKIGAKAFKNDKKLAKVLIKSKKLTTNAKVGSQAFKSTKSGIKFYIAKKAATFKKIKKVIKKKGQPTKAKYVKKYA